jgi:Pentapeptide repeats (8 copies)
VDRKGIAALVLVALIAAACSSSADSGGDEVGASCDLVPHVVCRNQDLRGVSMVAADVRGADFSGSDLRGSDLRDVNLANGKLVGALLGAANLGNANLKNANLTKANFFFTNLTGADLSGAILTDAFQCNVTQPDGSLVEGDCPSTGALPTATAPSAPPTITYFRLEPPGKCLNDAAGTGINVQWSTTNTTGISFAVDGIRIASSIKPKGTTRLPFVCDGKPHVAAMQAFGAPGAVATATLTASLNETAPLNANDG